MRILLCDENENISSLIKKIFLNVINHNFPNEKNEIVEVKSSFDLPEYLDKRNMEIDGILLNLDSDYRCGDNAIKIGKYIRENSPSTNLIFYTSADTKFREEVFDIEPLYVLLTPINEISAKRAVLKLWKKAQESRNRFFTIKAVDAIYRLNREDIKYIESEGRYINIYTKDEKVTSICKINEILPLLGDDFIRCHKSFVINTRKIKKIERSKLTIWDGTQIRVSRRYQSVIRNTLIEQI